MIYNSLFRRGMTKLAQKRFMSISQPLEILRVSSAKMMLCDHQTGFRKPDKHWAFGLAIALESEKAPILRTINIQRVTNDGIDFITKKGFSSENFAQKHPVSFLHTSGEYKPGEIVQQWRAEGYCKPLNLSEIINKASDYTISNIVASQRAAKEIEELEKKKSDAEHDDELDAISEGRKLIEQSSHFMEIVQSTRSDLEAGKISNEEMEECIRAFRFCPTRMELMVGGPDQITWNRWEWHRLEETNDWVEPKHIMPH